MIVADTGAIIALVDADDAHHDMIREIYEHDPGDWLLPWCILPEVDYLLGEHVSARARRAFMNDLASGAFTVEWSSSQIDLLRANKICERYKSLNLDLVDATVIAIAERLRAGVIATVDVRDFGAVKISGSPKLFPRDYRAG